MQLDKTTLIRTLKDYLFITFGVSLYAFGFASFILPHKVVIGGLSGLSTIVYFTTGCPIAIANYGFNLLLLAMAFKVVGKQFVIGTIFGATMISIMLGIAIPLCDGLFHLDPFLSCVIGGILAGTGIGITFTHNGSTGGSDIVAAMVSKHTNATIGRILIYVDMCIISSSFLIFGEIDKVVYGFVVLFIGSYMTDMVINTNRQAVQFLVFSHRWQEIATAINNQAKRGCTVLSGMGWYSKQEVKVLLIMARKIESVNIFRIIKSIDRDALISQSNVNGIYGLGFDQMKIKMKVSETPPKEVEHYKHPKLDDPVKTPGGHGII